MPKSLKMCDAKFKSCESIKIDNHGPWNGVQGYFEILSFATFVVFLNTAEAIDAFPLDSECSRSLDLDLELSPPIFRLCQDGNRLLRRPGSLLPELWEDGFFFESFKMILKI